jgi:hypothetical protein
MRLTNVKVMVAKVLTTGLLAGAFVLVVPAKAEAQGWQVGVQVGAPPYVYDRRAYYERARSEEIRREEYARQEAIARHEAWERQQAWARHEAGERQREYGYYERGRGNAYGHDRGDRDDHRDRDDR